MTFSAYNIVTSICIDIDGAGSDVEYITLGSKANSAVRRKVYWQCVYCFCASSTRVNSNVKHLVFTNDDQPVVIAGMNITKGLQNLGVEIIFLPFNEFDPESRSSFLRNAFYKLEVICALSRQPVPSILLDSDCIFHKKSKILDQLMTEGEYLLLQDTYQRNVNPACRIPHNLSMLDMGNLYKKINADYPTPSPIWYGGELVGGSPAHFQKIAIELEKVFSYLKREYDRGQRFVFGNDQRIFDNDEFITSYVYNKLEMNIFDTNNVLSRRIWTWGNFNRVRKSDLDIPIWHLPAEKRNGIELLFNEIRNEESLFWSSADLTSFIGKYVGIPDRVIRKKQSLTGYAKFFIYQLRGKFK